MFTWCFTLNVSNLLFWQLNYESNLQKKKKRKEAITTATCALACVYHTRCMRYSNMKITLVYVSSYFWCSTKKLLHRSFDYNDVVCSSNLYVYKLTKMTATLEDWKRVRERTKFRAEYHLMYTLILLFYFSFLVRLHSLAFGLKVWSQLKTNIMFMVSVVVAHFVCQLRLTSTHIDINRNNWCDF